ncbi:MAG: hypothetical protein JSR57_03610 [Verrucomicrobia bacterium]|nr:hypothetical protein [Verrucomicrobiota bacterium]
MAFSASRVGSQPLRQIPPDQVPNRREDRPRGVSETSTRMESVGTEVGPNGQVSAQAAGDSKGFCAQIGDKLKVFADAIWSAFESAISKVKSFFGIGAAANGGTLVDSPLEKFRADVYFVFERRDQLVDAFYQLPVADRNAVKAEMLRLAGENAQPVQNWADRVIRGEVQLPGEIEPRLDIQRHSARLFEADSILARAVRQVTCIQAGVSRLPNENSPYSIREFQQLLGERDLNRTLIFTAFTRLPDEVCENTLLQMHTIAQEELRRDNPSLQQSQRTEQEIAEWSMRVMFNVVRKRGETEDQPDIVRFVDILTPNSVFRRALERVAANRVSNTQER